MDVLSIVGMNDNKHGDLIQFKKDQWSIIYLNGTLHTMMTPKVQQYIHFERLKIKKRICGGLFSVFTTRQSVYIYQSAFTYPHTLHKMQGTTCLRKETNIHTDSHTICQAIGSFSGLTILPMDT